MLTTLPALSAAVLMTRHIRNTAQMEATGQTTNAPAVAGPRHQMTAVQTTTFHPLRRVEGSTSQNHRTTKTNWKTVNTRWSENSTSLLRTIQTWNLRNTFLI